VDPLVLPLPGAAQAFGRAAEDRMQLLHGLVGDLVAI